MGGIALGARPRRPWAAGGVEREQGAKPINRHFAIFFGLPEPALVALFQPDASGRDNFCDFFFFPDGPPGGPRSSTHPPLRVGRAWRPLVLASFLMEVIQLSTEPDPSGF